MRPLRIAMISEHASPLADLGGPDAGGQNVHVAQLATHLADRGHDVQVFTRLDNAALPPSIRTPEGYTVHHVPAGPAHPVPKDELLAFMPAFGQWLAARWRQPRLAPDIVHAHFWMSGVAARGALRHESVPYVVTFHALGTVKRRMQGADDTSPPQRLGLERDIARNARRVVAQCTDEIEELGAMGVDPARVSLISSGVDTSLFQPAPSGRPVAGRILTVGRLVPRKGFLRLVRALPQLPQAHLVVAGGPPHRELGADPVAARLREEARRLGVASRLRLLGSVPQNEMPALYRSAEVVACVPDYEPFGITPLEAMACGTPVVALAVGGLRDTVRHRSTGELVPPGDQAALATALRRLLSDSDIRERYAAQAVRVVRERYPWSCIAEAMERTYRAAIVESVLEPLAVAA
jgi:glycosyltransferase involved in cell wall biosynthesis